MPTPKNYFKAGNAYGKLSSRKLTEEQKKIKHATKDDLHKCWEVVRHLTINELQEAIKNKDTNGLMAMMASAQIHAIKHGDFSKIDKILDRILGKARQNIELSGDKDNPVSIEHDVKKRMLETVKKLKNSKKI